MELFCHPSGEQSHSPTQDIHTIIASPKRIYILHHNGTQRVIKLGR